MAVTMIECLDRRICERRLRLRGRLSIPCILLFCEFVTFSQQEIPCAFWFRHE